jgi:hypothetical protein
MDGAFRLKDEQWNLQYRKVKPAQKTGSFSTPKAPGIGILMAEAGC